MGVTLIGPEDQLGGGGGGGGLTDAQLRASPVAVSYSNTEATPIHTRSIDAPFTRIGFAEVGSGIIGNAANILGLRQTGSGMAVSQSGGNLVITSGTTTNSETVIRSKVPFTGSCLPVLSQSCRNAL